MSRKERKRAYVRRIFLIKLKFTVIALGVMFLIGGVQRLTYKETTVTIDSKERAMLNAKQSEYRVFCNEEVFKNKDSFFMLKFNSSDIQKDLKVGETYRIGVTGFRLRLLSQYRNIIKIIEE